MRRGWSRDERVDARVEGEAKVRQRPGKGTSVVYESTGRESDNRFGTPMKKLLMAYGLLIVRRAVIAGAIFVAINFFTPIAQMIPSTLSLIALSLGIAAVGALLDRRIRVDQRGRRMVWIGAVIFGVFWLVVALRDVLGAAKNEGTLVIGAVSFAMDGFLWRRKGKVKRKSE